MTAATANLAVGQRVICQTPSAQGETGTITAVFSPYSYRVDLDNPRTDGLAEENYRLLFRGEVELLGEAVGR